MRRQPAGLVVGLAGGPPGAPVVGLVIGLAGGIIIGLLAGLWAGLLGNASYPVSLASVQLAIAWSTPIRLMTFLNDAHSRNVLRAVGPSYQFRHALLQDRLAVPTTTRGRTAPTPASLAADPLTTGKLPEKNTASASSEGGSELRHPPHHGEYHSLRRTRYLRAAKLAAIQYLRRVFVAIIRAS